jgi:hypothetical protein
VFLLLPHTFFAANLLVLDMHNLIVFFYAAGHAFLRVRYEHEDGYHQGSRLFKCIAIRKFRLFYINVQDVCFGRSLQYLSKTAFPFRFYLKKYKY